MKTLSIMNNQDITDEIANSLGQVKLAREGKIKLKTLEILIEELENEEK